MWEYRQVFFGMICLHILYIAFITETVNANNIVETTNGYIRGKSVESGRVSAFLGIPYAEPPIGSLRFEKPVPKAPWRDVYDATSLPPPCIQGRFPKTFFLPDSTNMTEDCLYLNIWAPRTWNSFYQKPILIFIHGGYLMTGVSSMEVYDGARLAEYGDIIVASLNYRLSALGFLYGYIDHAAGNMGMYDQVTAIHWIKENARVFGGNPDNIVLMGHSAGSFSVSAHLISPLSQNLFRRAILLSGSIIRPEFNDNNRRLLKLSQKYAEVTGCSTNNTTLHNNPKAVIECMKRLPAETFSEVDAKVFIPSVDPFFLRTGDMFLPESPLDSYRKGNFRRKEILLGLTRNEGALFLPGFRHVIFGPFGELATSVPFNEETTSQILKDYIKTGFEFVDAEIIETYIRRVNEENGYTYLRAMVDAVGDHIINCGPIFQADFHSLRNDPVFFYMFEYRPPSTPFAEWMNITHFEDLPYYFGNPIHANFTEYEKRLSRYIMDMWITFIRTGDPNTGRGLMWPQYSYHDPKYLTLGESRRIEWSPELDRCEFWRSLLGAVMNDDVMRNLRESEWAEMRGVPRRFEFPRQPFSKMYSRGFGTLNYN